MRPNAPTVRKRRPHNFKPGDEVEWNVIDETGQHVADLYWLRTGQWEWRMTVGDKNKSGLTAYQDEAMRRIEWELSFVPLTSR